MPQKRRYLDKKGKEKDMQDHLEREKDRLTNRKRERILCIKRNREEDIIFVYLALFLSDVPINRIGKGCLDAKIG